MFTLRLLLLCALVNSAVAADTRKPGADVTLVAPEIISMALGESRKLNLKFVTPKREGILVVDMKLSEGLNANAASTHYEFDLAKGPATVELELSATSEGRHSLSFMVTLGDQWRVLGRSVYVGTKEQQLLQKSKAPSNGVVSMPAEEHISR